jgi:hypothetical protein
MSSTQMPPRQPNHQLDADAVCVQCGTVHAEETLICKTCGNNLRDQRSVRLAAEQTMGGEQPGASKGRWVLQGLALFGIVVILLTAFNIDAISRWMVNPAMVDDDFVRSMWVGGESAVYEGLLEELRAAMPTQEAIAAAAANPRPITQMDGIYGATLEGQYAVAIIRKADAVAPAAAAVTPDGTASPTDAPAGAAEPAEAGAEPAEQLAREVYHFVALMQPEGEVRGKLEARGANVIARERSAGMLYGDNFLSAWGAGLINTEGEIKCFATGAGSEEGLEFVAFQITPLS